MRYELGSPAWLEATHQVLQDCLTACERDGIDISQLTFSICEACTSPPPHLGGPQARVGWSCRVENGVIKSFEGREAEDVDYRMITDYDSLLAMGRFDTQGDPERAAEYAALTQSIYEAGKIQIYGKMPRLPRPFAAWHDAMARQTA